MPGKRVSKTAAVVNIICRTYFINLSLQRHRAQTEPNLKVSLAHSLLPLLLGGHHGRHRLSHPLVLGARVLLLALAEAAAAQIELGAVLVRVQVGLGETACAAEVAGDAFGRLGHLFAVVAKVGIVLLHGLRHVPHAREAAVEVDGVAGANHDLWMAIQLTFFRPENGPEIAF